MGGVVGVTGGTFIVTWDTDTIIDSDSTNWAFTSWSNLLSGRSTSDTVISGSRTSGTFMVTGTTMSNTVIKVSVNTWALLFRRRN
jgi:hypothetical protein